MNKLKFIALACALTLTAGSASAQFTTGGNKSMKGTSAAGDITGYDQITISYTNGHFGYDYPSGNDEPDPISTNGFSLKYLHGFSLSASLPMYIEAGLNFNYNFHSAEDDEGYSVTKFQHSALAIPVNFAYKFNVTETVAIKPFLGLNFKINTSTKSRMELTDKFLDDYKELTGQRYDGETESDWQNFFDKDDMGSKDATWNRFQLGWHIGVDFQFNKFLIGVNYGTDFIPAYKYKKYKVNSSTLNVGIGFCF